jgi:DNA mismatch repair protein MutS
VNPRELQQLNRSLKQIPPGKRIVCKKQRRKAERHCQQLHDCAGVIEKIDKVLKADPPIATNKGEVINEGVNAELDELRKIAYSGKDYLLKIQQEEQKRTGITSLKISYNNVFGYYFEVTNSHKDKVPAEWIRKQTLTNAERYITEELKQYEEKILGARR